MKIRNLLIVTVLSTLTYANAYFVGTEDVGDLDSVVHYGALSSSGDSAELAFINEYFDPDIDTYEKDTDVNTVDPATAFYVNGSDNIFAFELAFGSGYYLLKNAGCPNNSESYCNDTALIENTDSLQWGVLSYNHLQELGFHFGLGDTFTISHVVSIGENVQVPEPATLGLLIIGIVGIGAARRKKAA